MEQGEIKLAAKAIKQARYRFLRGNNVNLVLPVVHFEIMKLHALCFMLYALCLSVGYLPECFQLFHGGSRIDGFGSLHNTFGEIVGPPGSN